jgi:hypothetical protein
MQMNLDRKLMAYAAGAAAAAAFAGGENVEAGVVSHAGFDITSGSTPNIDFDSSGSDEYRIAHRTGPNRVFLKDSTAAGTTNAYLALTAGDTPAALPLGTVIGPGSTYEATNNQYLANPDGTPTGHFTVDGMDGNTEYLGLRFQLADGGPVYYGWAGVDITNSTERTGKVTSYAYDDTGSAIQAGLVPEPAGLALLALGSAFLIRRRPA